MDEKKCRCGWDGQGEHPCHADAYTCRKPAQHRFYNPQFVGLAGVQMKMQVTDTYACDACWEKFKQELEALRKKGDVTGDGPGPAS